MKEQDALRGVGDQIGTPTWANGLVPCVWKAVNKNISGILHWTDAGVASWYDFSVSIQELAMELGILEKPISISSILSIKYPTPVKICQENMD